MFKRSKKLVQPVEVRVPAGARRYNDFWKEMIRLGNGLKYLPDLQEAYEKVKGNWAKIGNTDDSFKEASLTVLADAIMQKTANSLDLSPAGGLIDVYDAYMYTFYEGHGHPRQLEKSTRKERGVRDQTHWWSEWSSPTTPSSQVASQRRRRLRAPVLPPAFPPPRPPPGYSVPKALRF